MLVGNALSTVLKTLQKQRPGRSNANVMNPRKPLDGHILQRGCAVVLTNEVLTRFLET